MAKTKKLPFLLFDIGGTNTRISVSKDGKRLRKPVVIKTPKDFGKAIKVFAERVGELDVKVKLAVGGVAGPLNTDREKILNAPNLPGWNKKPLKKRLEEALTIPVFLENDTALVGLGEAAKGAGKGYDIVAYLTVSTGVNGVRIVDGRIDKNALGFEIGKQIIDFESEETLEGITSGGAIEAKFGKKPEEIKMETFWDKEAEMLAIGVYNTVLYWSPEVVVMGGGVMNNFSIKKVNKYLKKLPPVFEKIPKVVEARLADTGGLEGALQYAKSL
jgi:predicted NBD/HSP70 family sugar kinase